MLAGPGPLLSPIVMDQKSIPKHSTLTSLSKDKCLQLVEGRIAILQYLKETHLGRRKWLHSKIIPQQEWQMLYSNRRGAKSYYSMGVSLSTVMDRTYASLKDYVFAVQTVMQYYDYYDSKKSMIPLEKQAQLTSPQLVSSSASIASGSTDSGSGSGSASFSGSGSMSGSASPGPSSSSFRRKRFTLGIATGTSSNSASPKIGQGASFQSSSELVDDSKSAFKSSAQPLSNKRPSVSVDTATTPSLPLSPATSPTLSKDHHHHSHRPRRGSTIPAIISKNSSAMSILSSLHTLSEEELTYLPDTFESIVTLFDTLIIFLYNVSYQLRGRELVFLELNEIEDNLKTIDDILKRNVTGELMLTILTSSSSSERPTSPTPASQTSLCRDADNLEKQIALLSEES